MQQTLSKDHLISIMLTVNLLQIEGKEEEVEQYEE
jgi:hypothetical protein